MSTTARASLVSAARNVGTVAVRRRSIFRHSPRDAWLVGQALLLVALLSFGLARVAMLGNWGAMAFASSFGLAMCWSSNTVSHNHLHRPLFRAKALNDALSWLLTLSMGVSQSLWRARHFWHHAGEPARAASSFVDRSVAVEATGIVVLWGALLAHSPRVFVTAYLPGYALGLLLCHLQGEMEHRQTGTATRGVSYYGKLYNAVWFNDGHHAEHHRFPSEHWSRLPTRSPECAATESDWPPLLRWVERERAEVGARQAALLGLLERLALGSELIQRFMLWSHERAFRRLLSRLPCVPERIAIIGGGLFPRTALVLRRILPRAQLTIIDHSDESLTVARDFFQRRRLDVGTMRFQHSTFAPELAGAYDVVVAPLAYVGDRGLLRTTRHRTSLFVHEWLWQRSSGQSAVISLMLLKRLSLLDGPEVEA
jgi:hypothetical protein